MNRMLTSVFLLGVLSIFNHPVLANPEAGVDFSQSEREQKLIVDTDDPDLGAGELTSTILNKVKATCPHNGVLIARASTTFILFAELPFDTPELGDLPDEIQSLEDIKNLKSLLLLFESNLFPVTEGIIVRYTIATEPLLDIETITPNHSVNLIPSVKFGGEHPAAPGFAQRVVRCKAGQAKVFRFLAAVDHDTTPDPNESVSASFPILVVEFFRDRI